MVVSQTKPPLLWHLHSGERRQATTRWSYKYVRDIQWRKIKVSKGKRKGWGSYFREEGQEAPLMWGIWAEVEKKWQVQRLRARVSLSCSRNWRLVVSCGQRSRLAAGQVEPYRLGKEIGFYSRREAVRRFWAGAGGRTDCSRREREAELLGYYWNNLGRGVRDFGSDGQRTEVGILESGPTLDVFWRQIDRFASRVDESWRERERGAKDEGVASGL